MTTNRTSALTSVWSRSRNSIGAAVSEFDEVEHLLQAVEALGRGRALMPWDRLVRAV